LGYARSHFRSYNFIRRTIAALIAGLSVFSAAAERPSQDEYMKWLNQQAQDLQQYKDERDAEFTKFLKAQWKEMAVYRGLKRDKKPKPISIPVAPPEPVIVAKPEPVKKVPLKPAPVTKAKPAPGPTGPKSAKPVKQAGPVKQPAKLAPKAVPESRPKPKAPVVALRPQPKPVPKAGPAIRPPVNPRGQGVTVALLGYNLSLHVDSRFGRSRLSAPNKDAISKFWGELSRADYEPLVKELDHYRRNLGLNDWAYAMLVNETAKKIYPRIVNEQRLFNWFIMIKSGFRARVGYSGQQVYLMLPARQKIYRTLYFTYGGTRFYLVDFEGHKQKAPRLYTYDAKYPGANRLVDMRMNSFPRSNRHDQEKVFRFKYGARSYSVPVRYDDSAVKFLRYYPQTDFSIYFSAEVNRGTGNALLENLRPLVKGKTETEAVNVLLRFVQTAFAYQTDNQQFGVEKYLFPEETLYYPYSDCEDRSFLFAWLVRNLLGLEVIGLEFPGHVATAVRFNGATRGDAVMFHGKKYTVADPTYINARAGMRMPQYRNTNPKVVSIPSV
jgi:hypothetical protein